MAIALGIDGIETDVWLSKDKVPILVHGQLEPNKGFVELENGLQNISEIESENLKNYTLKNGERILTLAEGLDFCKDQISLNIEFNPFDGILEEKNL